MANDDRTMQDWDQVDDWETTIVDANEGQAQASVMRHIQNADAKEVANYAMMVNNMERPQEKGPGKYDSVEFIL